MAPTFTFDVTPNGMLVAPRVLGLMAVPDLLAHVEACCSVGPPQLVIDFSDVEEVEPAALDALTWARHHCLDRGVDVVFVEPPAPVTRPRVRSSEPHPDVSPIGVAPGSPISLLAVSGTST